MKKLSLRMFVCLTVILGLTAFTFAGPGEVDSTKCGHSQVKQKLRAYFNQLAEEEFFSGSVLVAREGRILLKKGYGMADYEEGRRNTPRTVHAIASFTKAFTSMSIMMLEERGLVSVNDTIADYIPGFPNGDQVTLHHLLSHSSGLFDYTLNPLVWENMDIFHTPEDLLQYYMNEPFQFDAGTQFQYSNSNYVTLGIIIERVSGMSYRDFIKENILGPLKMNHTSYDPYLVDFPRKAVGYNDLEPPTAAMFFHPSISYSAGAMSSTVMDLLIWDEALHKELLVSTETLEKMFTPGLGDYGYGWYIDYLEVDGQMHRQTWHWGSYFGFHSHISRLVDDKIIIIILLNTPSPTDTPTELTPIIQAAASIIFAD